MIEFKIISTVDRSQISTYQHFGTELSFGNAEGDMLIDDPQLAPLQLRVKVQGNQAVLENLGENEVRINGKPIEGEVAIKEKDNVTIGKTSIQFLRLDSAPATPPEAIDNRNAANRFAPGTKESAILAGLEYLERQSAESTGFVPRPGGPPKPPIPPLPGRSGPTPPPPPPLPKKS